MNVLGRICKYFTVYTCYSAKLRLCSPQLVKKKKKKVEVFTTSGVLFILSSAVVNYKCFIHHWGLTRRFTRSFSIDCLLYTLAFNARVTVRAISLTFSVNHVCFQLLWSWFRTLRSWNPLFDPVQPGAITVVITGRDDRIGHMTDRSAFKGCRLEYLSIIASPPRLDWLVL